MLRGVVTARIEDRSNEKEWGPDGEEVHTRGHLKKINSSPIFHAISILWNLRMARVASVTIPLAVARPSIATCWT